MNRISSLLLSGLFGSCALPSAAFERVMTAPPEPSAGQATTLVFRAATVGDLDPSTLPVASVVGTNIRIDLNDECDQIFCDVAEQAFFRVELPALSEGEYQVQLFDDAASSEPRGGSFVFSVGPAVDVSLTRPAEGAWSDDSTPGTGLYLQTRGPLLSVAQFDYLDDRAHWRLDVTPMRGDSAVVLLRNFGNGSCFGCDPFEAPSSALGGTPLLITFESARRARVKLSDGTVVPIVSFPFGVGYVPVTLADFGDDEFGPLALPDLSGTWAFRDQVVSFGPAETEGQSVRFPPVGDSLIELVCGETVSGSARCTLFALPPPTGPVIGLIPPIASALLGNVEENRVRFVSTSTDDDFYMVRIPTAD